MTDVRKILQPGGDEFAATAASKELSPRRSDGRRPTKNHLERGWVKHRLIRDFALGERTQRELAEQYGVSPTSISSFKSRHTFEIEEVRNNLADEYAGVWVAQKLARIQEYQELAEKTLNGNSPRHAEVAVTILKAVAEELGQLPTRNQVNVSTETTVYQVVGVSVDDI